MDEPPLAAEDARRLRRENEHLKARVNQLQGEVWDLSGRLARTMRALDLAAASPSPASANEQ